MYIAVDYGMAVEVLDGKQQLMYRRSQLHRCSRGRFRVPSVECAAVVRLHLNERKRTVLVEVDPLELDNIRVLQAMQQANLSLKSCDLFRVN